MATDLTLNLMVQVVLLVEILTRLNILHSLLELEPSIDECNVLLDTSLCQYLGGTGCVPTGLGCLYLLLDHAQDVVFLGLWLHVVDYLLVELFVLAALFFQFG